MRISDATVKQLLTKAGKIKTEDFAALEEEALAEAEAEEETVTRPRVAAKPADRTAAAA